MMPAWVYIGTAIWLCTEALANIWWVGKEREPKTPGDAIIAVLGFGWTAFLLLSAVLS